MQKSLEGIKPLAGLKVIDIATLFAAPFAATLFGDFGADVIKVEIPGHGDPLRSMGSTKNKVPLWWKIYSRNKQTITIDLRTSSGQNVLKELVRDADVLIENFRPGTMESWNLGWENLKELNPKLIMLRVSGYGRTGPYSNKPGFGTLCEGMSGFAVLNGQPNGPPTVAPMAVGDCIAGLYGAVGVLVALFARAQGLCQGQAVDVSLLDSLFSIIAYQVAEYEHMGKVLERTGNRSDSSVPRNIYRTRDNHWITVSSSSNSVALRVLQMVGGDEMAKDERFSTPNSRTLNADALDELVAAWILERDLDQAMAQFEKFDAAASPAYNIAQIFNDPHFHASETLLKVQDDELGPMHMPNIVPRLSVTPGAVRFAGRSLGKDTEQILRERTSLSEEQISELLKLGIV